MFWAFEKWMTLGHEKIFLSASHYPRHTVQNRPFPEIGWCFFDDVPDGSRWNIHEYWGVWRILPRKAGIFRACPLGRFWHGKSPQMPKCRRLQAPWSMAGAEGFEPSARGFGGNVEIFSRSSFAPILGICYQTRSWWWKNWCYFDDVLNSAPDYWCSWW